MCIRDRDNIFAPEWGEHEYIIESDTIDEQFIIDNADILVDYFKEQDLTKADLELDLARLATPHLT